MSPPRTITARPLPKGGWSLEVDGMAARQVRRLEQAEDEVRSALRDLPGEATFRLDIALPDDVAQGVASVEQAQVEAEAMTLKAREARRELVLHLNQDLHLPLRDIAVILGLSYQRVSALMKTSSRP